MKQFSATGATRTLACALCISALPAMGWAAEAEVAGAPGKPVATPSAMPVILNRTIGYLISDKQLATNVTADPEGAKVDCPDGMNEGPREHFARKFPDEKQRSVVNVLQQEADIWFPTADYQEPSRFLEPVSKVANGLNLDGKVKPTDYTSPSGEAGIDNQIFRAVGCIAFFRKPGGVNYYSVPLKLLPLEYNTSLLELTEVDDLENDNSVTVTFYQGLDASLKDAQGNAAPRGSHRVSERWGKKFIHSVSGRIVDGMLTTEPSDVLLPDASGAHGEFTYQWIRAARLKVKLTTEGGEGLLGGSMDIWQMYMTINKSWDTGRTAYGNLASQSYYSALARHADGYPDASGRNTAISGAWELKLTQTFILHSAQEGLTSKRELAKGRRQLVQR